MSRAPEPPAATPRRPGPGSVGASLQLQGDDFTQSNETAPGDLAKRMAGWARLVAARLRHGGLDLAVTVSGTSEGGRPCAFFLPRGATVSGAAATLVLRIEADEVRVGLELAPAHAGQVDQRLADPARALAFSSALEALPEQFVVRLGPNDAPLQAVRCGMSDLRPLLERGAREDRVLWIGWCVPRELALEHAAHLDEQLEDSLAALGTVYWLLTSGTDGSATEPRPNRVGRLRANARAGVDDERERRPHGAPSAPPLQRRPQPRAREERRDRESERESEIESEVSGEAGARPPGVEEGGMPVRAVFRRRTLRAVSRKNDPALPIERGARVRVLDGAFSGKIGVVQDLDGKGGARVMLGLLAVRLDVKNLTVHGEGRYRPVLPSSHRKPVPVRS